MPFMSEVDPTLLLNQVLVAATNAQAAFCSGEFETTVSFQ